MLQIEDQINKFINQKNGIKAFFQETNLADIKDIKNYAENTKNIAHLDFLADFPNYNVLESIAMNAAIYSETPAAKKVCEKLMRACADVPGILNIMGNKSKKLGMEISWVNLTKANRIRNRSVQNQLAAGK